jgi:peptidoglycan/LPS O-acetylase OafA/YrhL
VTSAASRRRRLAGLDGLRALAAIAVLSYHVALFSRFAFAGPFASVLWELKGGVAVFFVISGTVLYLPYARALRDRKRLPDWREYAGRRVVRIVPAYWLALTVFALGPFAAGVLGPNAWSYYGLSQIYGSHTLFSGLGVAWSLCVEVTFYALLPLFTRTAAYLLRRAGPRSALRAHLGLIALTGLSSIVLRGALAGSFTAPIASHGVTLTIALPGFLDWFALGMTLAVLAAEWEAGRQPGPMMGRLADRPGWCMALALGVFGLGIPTQHGDMFLPWYGLVTHLALGAGSGLLVLAAIAVDRDRGQASWARLLGSAWLGWVGTVSYGIYLWHLMVLELISRRPDARSVAGAMVLWFAVLGGAVVLGAASWYLLERPLQRAFRARERRTGGTSGAGHTPNLDAGVHSVSERLNSPGVAVDHLA